MQYKLQSVSVVFSRLLVLVFLCGLWFFALSVCFVEFLVVVGVYGPEGIHPPSLPVGPGEYPSAPIPRTTNSRYDGKKTTLGTGFYRLRKNILA